MVLDTEAGGGVRLQQGVQTADEIEQRLWNDSSFDDASRCDALRRMFKDFTGQAGTWTAERAARIETKCAGK